MNTIDFVLREVRQELQQATQDYEPIANLHEGYAVILEELDESWEEIKHKRPNLPAVRHELIQTAAMVVRTIADVLDHGGM